MKRILVVDSDMAVRSEIGRHARLEGYEVAEASDGYTAVALCRQKAFDFVILAILLPELDGFSVCQTIRSFSRGSERRVRTGPFEIHIWTTRFTSRFGKPSTAFKTDRCAN